MRSKNIEIDEKTISIKVDKFGHDNPYEITKKNYLQHMKFFEEKLLQINEKITALDKKIDKHIIKKNTFI